MVKKNSVVPIDQLEFVDVNLTLAVTDCFHMNELFLNVTSALTAVDQGKISLLQAQFKVVDDETGELKYDQEDFVVFPAHTKENISYYINDKNQAIDEDNQIIFDRNIKRHSPAYFILVGTFVTKV